MNAVRYFGPPMLATAPVWFGIYLGPTGSRGKASGWISRSCSLRSSWGSSGQARHEAWQSGVAALVVYVVGIAAQGDFEAWSEGQFAWFGLLGYVSIAIAGQTVGTVIRGWRRPR